MLIMLILKFLPNHPFLGSRGYYSSNFWKYNSNCLMLEAVNSQIHGNVCCQCPHKDFLILTLQTLKASLVWSLISFFGLPTHAWDMHISHFLNLWETINHKNSPKVPLVAKMVLYKSSIDIAPLPLTFHVINRWFVCWQNNGLLEWP